MGDWEAVVTGLEEGFGIIELGVEVGEDGDPVPVLGLVSVQPPLRGQHSDVYSIPPKVTQGSPEGQRWHT